MRMTFLLVSQFHKGIGTLLICSFYLLFSRYCKKSSSINRPVLISTHSEPCRTEKSSERK